MIWLRSKHVALLDRQTDSLSNKDSCVETDILDLKHSPDKYDYYPPLKME
jgi:hypothetical protein